MKNFLIYFVLLTSTSIFAQVKIGENPQTINQNSILELESDTKALVVTRITTSQMNAMTPLEGAIIYNTDEDCLFQYNNNSWNSLCVDVMANETVTSIIDNGNGTLTYTDESGTNTIISLSDADSDTTNELNQTMVLNGTNLETTDAGGTIITDLSALDQSADIANSEADIATNATDIADHIAADLDTDATNEIQTVESTDGSVTVTPNGNDFDLSITIPANNDNDATNELNQTVVLNGTNLETTDAGGTITTDLSSLDQSADIANSEADIANNAVNIATNATDIADHIAADLDTDATNEIQTVESTDGSVTVTPNGNDFDLSITIPANNDNDATNELNQTVVLNGTNLETTDAGGTITTDLFSLDESAEVATNTTNITTNATNIADHIAADLDTDATNEIQTVESTDGSVTVIPNGNDFDLSITIPANNDNDATNELNQTVVLNGTNLETTDAGGTITTDLSSLDESAEVATNAANIATNATDIADHIAADLDTDATNEIQNVESTDGSVTVTPNGNDFDLSITIPANNDNDATNELNQTVVLNGTNLETTDAGGTITTDLSSLDQSAEVATNAADIATNATDIADHIAADLDTDATNEIQNVESTDGSVTVTPNGNDFDLSVTPYDDSSLQTQITANADDIDDLQADQITQNTAITNNATAISDNADAIVALEAEQVTQNNNIANNTTAITNHIAADGDTDATNEIQSLTQVGNNVTLSNGGGTISVADNDNDATNELQEVTSSNNSVGITQNGNDFDLSVIIPANNDNDATNEIQDISTNGDAGNISLTNGSTLNLNIDDADADATNEIQILTQTGNTVTLSNSGGTISVADNDNNATNEIQVITSTDGSVTVTPDANNNYNLSVITPTNNDNDPTNEITTVTDNLDGTTTILDVNGGTVTVDNDGVDNVDDADNDVTNELQDISLNGTELQLSTPATAGNLVDLTDQITLPMFANGANTNDEIYWNGTDWVYGTRVATVNLISPDADGNVNIPIGNVYTGPTTTTGDIGPNEVGGSPQEGDIYVVNSDAPDPAQVGNTYIYDIDTMDWIAIDPFNAALYDPRYVNVTGDTMVGNLDMNGNTVTDLGTPTGATDAAPKGYVDNMSLVDNNDGTFSLNKPDGTIDTINKAFLTDNLDGTFTFNNNDGNPVTINISDLETTTTLTDNGNQTFTYVNEDNTATTFSIADNDNDASNEIQTVESTDGSVTITPNGNDFDLSVTIPTNNDNDATNEIQTLSQVGTNVTLSNGGGTISVADNDNDATNEIQTISSSDNSIAVTQTNNDYDLSITIPANNDNDSTNEIQDISTNGNPGNITISNGSTINLNTDDADSDITNEIQIITSSDNSVAITETNNNYDLTVTPFDDSTLQSQITTNANDIDALEAEQVTQNANITDNTTAIADHIAADLDTDATNEIQTVESTDGSVTVTPNGNDFDLSITIPANNDNDATNELNQTVVLNGTNIETTDAGGTITTDLSSLDESAEVATNASNIATNATDIADHIAADLDTDATNEIQTIESIDGSVTVTPNGNDFDLSITIPTNNDNDATNELNQTVVLNGTNLETTDAGGTITTDLSALSSNVTQVVTAGNTIATHTSGTTTTNIVETTTSLSQNDASPTGEITYTNEANVTATAQVVAAETDNQIEVGANGGAYLGPTVYTGTFIITATGNQTITGLPFEPSSVTFVAHANVETLDLDSDNGVGNNNTGIANSFGTMNGFARNDSGSITQQVIYVGGSGNSINDISRFASSSRCIGLRYGNQNGDAVGRTLASLSSFNTDGFTLNVTNKSDNVVVIFTAYK
ncbi:hypothetical protein [Lacinutrix sp. 5H-3-7-4]|uniref:beta strand repeat-containing protein n=1 Tax=Lacinutrix sp. (strain 5H-3-7-4) TaxID=983544 RepID=UPI0002115405|nr:hypothetical protein [Lacinutrix sp. 5H-3-7-4]AEH00342.1 hypothetical protein Lacal_0490 [Lacinutrix sp. 5H-3-7-4]